MGNFRDPPLMAYSEGSLFLSFRVWMEGRKLGENFKLQRESRYREE